ncbi:MAG: hypothetical protein V4677_13045 [Bacteroidota bacterium]
MSEEKTTRKRDLLPLWIKIFLWIFLVMACIVPVVIVSSILKIPASLSLYGMETNYFFTVYGVIISVLMLYKGIVAFGLWTEKKWAVSHAIIDAIVGITACVVMTLVPLFSNNGMHFTFRLELIALIPYLIKMKNIKREWNDEPLVEEKEKEEPRDAEPPVVVYSRKTYKCEDGILSIDQEFQNPNLGEKVFLNDKPAPFGKYKLGFMSYIFVDNGIIEKISST